MKFDHLTTASVGMESVHVLGNHPHFAQRFQCCHKTMRVVGAGAATGALNLKQIFPRQRGIALEHVAGENFLNGQAFIDRDVVVEPAHSSISGQA